MGFIVRLQHLQPLSNRVSGNFGYDNEFVSISPLRSFFSFPDFILVANAKARTLQNLCFWTQRVENSLPLELESRKYPSFWTSFNILLKVVLFLQNQLLYSLVNCTIFPKPILFESASNSSLIHSPYESLKMIYYIQKLGLENVTFHTSSNPHFSFSSLKLPLKYFLQFSRFF